MKSMRRSLISGTSVRKDLTETGTGKSDARLSDILALTLLHIDEQLAHRDRDGGVLAHDLEVVVWWLRNTLGVSGAAAARSRARRKASASLCSGGRLSSRKKRRYGSSDLASCTVIEGASRSCVSWQSSTSSPSTSRA